MTYPIASFIQNCRPPTNEDKNASRKHPVLGEKVTSALTIVDGVALLTTLALGVLSLLSIVAMPAVVSYVLLGLSGAIIALWVAKAIQSKGENFTQVKDAFKNTLCASKT
jgi:hypothetical protein